MTGEEQIWMEKCNLSAVCQCKRGSGMLTPLSGLAELAESERGWEASYKASLHYVDIIFLSLSLVSNYFI